MIDGFALKKHVYWISWIMIDVNVNWIVPIMVNW